MVFSVVCHLCFQTDPYLHSTAASGAPSAAQQQCAISHSVKYLRLKILDAGIVDTGKYYLTIICSW